MRLMDVTGGILITKMKTGFITFLFGQLQYPIPSILVDVLLISMTYDIRH